MGELIQHYIDDVAPRKQLGRTSLFDYKVLLRWPIAEIVADRLSMQDMMMHVKARRAGGAGPATAANDIVRLRTALRVSSASLGASVNLSVIDQAAENLRSQNVTGRPVKRERRPTDEELAQLREFFQSRDARAAISMADIVDFAVLSARRQNEICAIRWKDLNADDMTCLVQDMKHPTQKYGNDRRFKLLTEAWAIIIRGHRLMAQITTTLSVRFSNDAASA